MFSFFSRGESFIRDVPIQSLIGESSEVLINHTDPRNHLESDLIFDLDLEVLWDYRIFIVFLC